MIPLQSARVRLNPSTATELCMVREELRAVLASPHFTTSKRYPAFLKYVVQETLEGRADELKERTLGVEVFHRAADYDTHNDTIVRFAAGEVRKRLALVYYQSEFEHLLQITLSPGSYAPEFLVLAPSEQAPALASERPEPKGIEHSGIADLNIRPPRQAWSAIRRASVAVLLLLLALTLAAGLLVYRTSRPNSAVDAFWQPMMQGSQAAILCPGALVLSTKPPASLVRADKDDEYPYISMTTAGTITKLATMFGSFHAQYRLLPASAINLTDLRQHPVVMIGAYNNDWTIRLVSKLRFRFAPQSEVAIFDSSNPRVRWKRPLGASYDEGDDYAIIARYYDRLTEGMVIVIGGLGKNGTEAAAQFVTSNQYLQSLKKVQAKDWANKNIELVIRTSVVDSKTGAPTIEAVYVW
jgi:hypothetical protein